MNRQFNTTVKRELFVWNNILVVKGHNCGLIPSQNSAKKGVPLQVYTLKHVISVVKRKF